ncbi:sel1 repeat family protein [Candidatus Parcubacteria bacterium]|jgi:TPR repeat protein|uniref:SEL1-like repeat protein n=1 Tax=Fusibacter paucivorans TaxID=76009 RepID=A0ABS5PSQ9_9FIRM|nr:MobP3 family relaxase [Fusibacter paucivorans]MBS7527102.1 SEL1-like repeat protein [Fusibacter paucivorans]RJQ27883.1 MAG: sel1 repeat family protein [Candidatus Parcubacteria bacterium]
MPRIVLKCPYLKGGTKKSAAHLSNLVTYMATRCGVEKLPKERSSLPSTLKQGDLIQQIINEFPEAKKLFEYEDYIESKTVENASEFITMALEQNMDIIGQRENYVDYIANRPRVQRMGTHGLFTGGDDEIALSRIAEEVGNHPGNIWIPIISLRREDAIRTGFDKVKAWHNMLSYFTPEIAEAMKIPIQNFRWYAAFHNESHHPHVHMVCYSTDPNEGFLTKKGIEQMKSGLVKNIFKGEVQEIYAQQTERRDQLKCESNEALLKLIGEMKTGHAQNPKIEALFLELSEKLKHSSGKKVYGYLQPSLKKLVDELIDELSKEDIVAKAYELWYEMREEVFHSYMDEIPNRLPLSEQKEFKAIKNMIIAEANQFSFESFELEEITAIEESFNDEIPGPHGYEVGGEFNGFDYEQGEVQSGNVLNENDQDFYVDWTDAYKMARKLLVRTEDIPQDFKMARIRLEQEAEIGNVLAIYDLGRIYSLGLGLEKNSDTADEYYVKAFTGFQQVESSKAWKYTEYRIGKMHAAGQGTDQDYQKAAEWFQLSAEKKYKYAQYSLGALYNRGQGVDQDFNKAFELYLKSAKQGFPYSKFEVAKMYRDGIGTDKDETKSRQYFQRAFKGFESLEETSKDDKIQYRLGWMLQNGVGAERDLIRAKDYYLKSTKMGNVYSSFALAKIVLKEENPEPDELKKVMEFLQSVADSDDVSLKDIKNPTAYSLGKLFLEGKVVAKNIAQAIHYLDTSNEYGNPWASYQLGKLYLQGKEMPKNIEKAIQYLTSSAETGNSFSQYLLGKNYLLGKDVPKDKEQAIKWLRLSAEQGNEYAKFFLDNIDKFGDPSVALVVSRLLKHMSKIFEETRMPYRNPNGMKIDSKLLRKLKEKKAAQGHKGDDLKFDL